MSRLRPRSERAIDGDDNIGRDAAVLQVATIDGAPKSAAVDARAPMATRKSSRKKARNVLDVDSTVLELEPDDDDDGKNDKNKERNENRDNDNDDNDDDDDLGSVAGCRQARVSFARFILFCFGLKVVISIQISDYYV